MKVLKNNTGFTLVELMVVVAIIGILTGIGFASYSTIQHNTEVTVCDAQKRILMNYEAMYYSTNGTHTDSYINSSEIEEDYELVTTGFLSAEDVNCPANGTYTWGPADANGNKDIICSIHDD